MAPVRVGLVALLLAAACTPVPVFSDLVACLAPTSPGLPSEASIPALVDRADVIVLATVVRAERTNRPGFYDDQGARRVTLRTTQTAKGSAPAEVVVLDGPCPMLAATEGETLIVLLQRNPESGDLNPIGFPTSALRATANRSLPELMAEIGAVRPLDEEARLLFERNGWTVTAKRAVSEFRLPALSGFGLAGREIRGAMGNMTEPFERYAVLSAEVGLDPRPYAGQRAELLTFWLERKPPEFAERTPSGHALIAGRQLIGAWVTVFADGGPFSVRDRAGALAAPAARRSFPPPNRAPQGINMAQAYDLVSTRLIAFKTGAGGNGQISDAARIRAFVDALGVTLPTTQAIWDPSTSRPTTYYLNFDSEIGSLSAVYESEAGVLTVASDGFSVRPGQRFADLVANIQ